MGGNLTLRLFNLESITMGKLFGTDGIRGVANEYPMTPGDGVKSRPGGGSSFRRYQTIGHIDRQGHQNIGAND